MAEARAGRPARGSAQVRTHGRRHPRALQAAAAVVALATTAAIAGCAQESGASSTDVVGQGFVSGDGSVRTWDPEERSAPVTVVGTDYENRAIDTSHWLGDVVLLNTWYAECAPCRAEAPDLVALANDRADEGVKVLGINTTDAPGAALAFQRTFEVPYPSIDDRDGRAVAVLSGTVPLQAVPSTVVLDRQGRVASRIVGLAEASTLNGLVDDALAEQAG